MSMLGKCTGLKMIGRELVCVFEIHEKDPNNGEIMKTLAKIINVPLKERENIFSIKVPYLSSNPDPSQYYLSPQFIQFWTPAHNNHIKHCTKFPKEPCRKATSG